MFEQEETHNGAQNTNHYLYFRDAVQSQHNANSFVLRFYLTSCLSTDEYVIEKKKFIEKLPQVFFWLVY